VPYIPRKGKISPLRDTNSIVLSCSYPKLGANNMAQVFEYNSKKNACKVMYNLEMQDSMPSYSELNQI